MNIQFITIQVLVYPSKQIQRLGSSLIYMSEIISSTRRSWKSKDVEAYFILILIVDAWTQHRVPILLDDIPPMTFTFHIYAALSKIICN